MALVWCKHIPLPGLGFCLNLGLLLQHLGLRGEVSSLWTKSNEGWGKEIRHQESTCAKVSMNGFLSLLLRLWDLVYACHCEAGKRQEQSLVNVLGERQPLELLGTWASAFVRGQPGFGRAHKCHVRKNRCYSQQPRAGGSCQHFFFKLRPHTASILLILSSQSGRWWHFSRCWAFMSIWCVDSVPGLLMSIEPHTQHMQTQVARFTGWLSQWPLHVTGRGAEPMPGPLHFPTLLACYVFIPLL